MSECRAGTGGCDDDKKGEVGEFVGELCCVICWFTGGGCCLAVGGRVVVVVVVAAQVWQSSVVATNRIPTMRGVCGRLEAKCGE